MDPLFCPLFRLVIFEVHNLPIKYIGNNVSDGNIVVVKKYCGIFWTDKGSYRNIYTKK